jgi:glycosyltransferase involved in cell wall biosynthesis
MSFSPATDHHMVTVVVPTHNRADVVAKTIGSVVWQRDFSVGDGSPEGN